MEDPDYSRRTLVEIGIERARPFTGLMLAT
jgi:hypothetical protein